MSQGKVKWFSVSKGYGFIEQDNGEDVFVHHTEVQGELREGDAVEFDLGETPKGPCATNVRSA